MLALGTQGGKLSGGKLEPSQENTWTRGAANVWSAVGRWCASFLSKISTWFYLFGFLLWKTRSSWEGGAFISARRFKARKQKGREQSSSVWKGRLLGECLNFNSPSSPLHWQRQGSEWTLLFYSLWKQRYERCVTRTHKYLIFSSKTCLRSNQWSLNTLFRKFWCWRASTWRAQAA